MTEAFEGAVRHMLMVQARAHSEFLLASGTANLTSTSALYSCFCSRAGQSKRVPAKASASNLSPFTNHLSSSISMLRMGWTCWQSSSRYCLETLLSCQSSCSWETVEVCASRHHPITIPSHHSGASMMDRGVPSLGRKKKKRKVALSFFLLPPQ